MTISIFLPTFLSMLIIGTWHGPSWTYVVFGAMHGIFMITNEIYNVLTRKKRRKKKDTRGAIFCYRPADPACICERRGPIPIRDNLSDAVRIFGGMAGSAWPRPDPDDWIALLLSGRQRHDAALMILWDYSSFISCRIPNRSWIGCILRWNGGSGASWTRLEFPFFSASLPRGSRTLASRFSWALHSSRVEPQSSFISNFDGEI